MQICDYKIIVKLKTIEETSPGELSFSENQKAFQTLVRVPAGRKVLTEQSGARPGYS